ncbi:hypothetical protein D3C75_833700 [compost metagenome]
MGLIDADVGKVSASQLHFWRAGRVGATGSAFQHAGGGQQLRTMANGGNGLACGVKGLHQLDDLRVQAQILWRSAAGDQQGVVVCFSGCRKIGVQGETMTRFLTVGLRAVKIMDRRHDVVAYGLIGAHGIHLMTYHL